jgi:hypothetical protein
MNEQHEVRVQELIAEPTLSPEEVELLVRDHVIRHTMRALHQVCSNHPIVQVLDFLALCERVEVEIHVYKEGKLAAHSKATCTQEKECQK